MRHAVILAGGSGQRLWPASRRDRPKQFLPLGARAGESLLAATRRRLGRLCPPERIVVVTAAAQVEQARAALPDLAADAILAEPMARNTAAALGLAAVYLLHRDPDAVLGALPADHHIADEARFIALAEQAFALAEQRDVIATIGITPTRPETGFGYLQVGEPLDGDAGVFTVRRFVEKPDAETARRYLDAGDYLWNGGMFFVRAERLLAELERHMPATAAGLRTIAQGLQEGGEGGEAVAEAAARVYPLLPSISIDHGVMEHADDMVTLRGDFGWNDVGSWAALAEYRPTDASGNVTQGTAVLHDAANNIVVGDTDHAIALIGVKDLIVVQSGNSILVVPRERAQEVREVVSALQAQELDRYL